MKKSILKLFAIIALGGFTFISCEDSNSNDILNESSELTEEETIALIESDDISDDVDNYLDTFIAEDFSVASKDEVSKESEITIVVPDCVIKTVVIEGATKTVTFDFGEGCEFPFGDVLAGKMMMSYVYDIDAKTVTITHTFDGFTFNDVLVEGENVIVRTKENSDGNPQSVKTMDVKHTWPDGEFTSKKGTVTREWIEGAGTKNWGDNVFIITGTKTVTFKDGTVCTLEVVDGLRREIACRFIVSGVLKITKGDREGTLNFGDGSCDNTAIFTNSNGEEKEITLRKRVMNK